MKSLQRNARLWNLFTRKDEYKPLQLDQHERVPYDPATQPRITIPAVSDFLIENGFHPTYPDSRRFAVCLTHDIDTLFFTKRQLASRTARALWRLNLPSAFRNTLSLINKRKTPLWNLPKIMALEKEYDATSTFLFLALEETDLGFSYSLENWIQEIGVIIDSGWEIGLHGSYHAFNDLQRILLEKKRLETILANIIVGYRNHFLRFKLPTTWELLRSAGFHYDVTYGFPEAVGFRNGMCHPYYPFNLETNQFIKILEIPLVIMDTSLFQYMGLDIRGAWEVIKNLISVIEERRGAISLLWHNSSMFDERLKLYEKILAFCANKNAWLTSGVTLQKWWTKNSWFDLR